MLCHLKLLFTLTAALCAFAPAPPATAGERTITLPECLKLTVDYSRDVLIADQGKIISQGRYLEERAAALPQLSAESSFVRVHDDSLEIFDVGDVPEGQSGGLVVKPDHNEYHANLNLTQALFTWGQIGAAIKAANYDKASAEHKHRQARQLAMREAATGFYNLLLTIELEKAARDSLAQKQRHLDETEKKHKLEVATDYDVLAARVELTNAKPPLTQAENDIRLARDRLRYYMGIEDDFTIKGDLVCRPQPPESLPTVLEQARANRPEIAFYQSQVGVYTELVTVAKAGNKPRLDFKGNMGWTGYDGIDADYPGKRFDAGVYLSIPLFEGFRTRGQVMQANSRLSTTELEYKKLLDDISLEARGAIHRVDEAVQIVQALDATTGQADRLLQMAELGYRNGVKTKLEVDDAELNLLTARTNLARARRDYLVARTRLLWIMGTDLETALQDAGTCIVGPAPPAKTKGKS
jgi:HAE1 family hydrophobic/amphiphilic exporter-1